MLLWRRSFNVRPPELELTDPRHPVNELKYNSIDTSLLPATECLKDTIDRFLPYWHETILPSIQQQQKVLIVAHGNSLRALVKYLDGLSDEEILDVNIPTGIPLVYDLDEKLNVKSKKYLGDEETINQLMNAVKNQGKA